MPNKADRDGKAPYVLVDQGGTIRTYVRPLPGVDLQPFLGRQVTLEGSARVPRGGGLPLLQVEEVVPVQSVKAVSQRVPPPPKKRADGVRQVQHDATPEEVPRGAALTPVPANPEGPAPAVIGGYEDSDCGPACAVGGECGDSCGPCNPCFFPAPSTYWVQADYLLWWTRGMHVPPLVTTGPSFDQPGYLNSAGTEILFGNESVNDRVRSGGRLQVGKWLDCYQCVGIEGEYLALEGQRTNFRVWSDGNPPISRPFFDVTRLDTDDPQNVEFVANETIQGSVSVNTSTRFQSAGARMRFNLCNSGCDPCSPVGRRLDFLVGYRFLRLDDGVGVREELTSTDVESPGAFLVIDEFGTKNQFHGAELGLVFQRRYGRWSLDTLTKVALGNNHEIAYVNGGTRTTDATGAQRIDSGGLLALSSNINRYSKDEFAVVPEAGLTLGFQWTPRLKTTFGYSFIYWSQVARAGDQIDFAVNPTLLPNGGPPVGDTTRPAFNFHQTGFWAQGLNFGAELRW